MGLLKEPRWRDHLAVPGARATFTLDPGTILGSALLLRSWNGRSVEGVDKRVEERVDGRTRILGKEVEEAFGAEHHVLLVRRSEERTQLMDEFVAVGGGERLSVGGPLRKFAE